MSELPPSKYFLWAPGDRVGQLNFFLQITRKGCSYMAKIKKTTRIQREKNRLSEVFKDMDANKLKVCEALIDRAAFITIGLQDLEEELNATGWTETYTNGKNQEGVKQSAAASAHVSLTKNLSAIMKQLLDLVPPAQKASRLEALMDE